MSPDSYVGTVSQFAGSFVPRHWAPCNGQLMSIRNYTALYSIVGTIYGGDGVNTFALPDMNDRTSQYQDKPIWHICIEGTFPQRT